MINASKEFNQVVYGQENKIYVGKATIKLYDNTVLEVDSSEIWQGGIEITEQTSNSGNFDIGFCSCKQLVLRLKNINNEFSSYDFYDAKIVPFVGLELSETTEYIKKGVFTVDDPVSQGPYISLTCLDNMHKLDKNVTSLSGSTAGQLVLNIANACGVTLANVNFDGHNMGLDIPEDITQYTYRQVLSYICQVIGAFAYFDTDGNLVVKWYDTGAFEQSDNLDGGIFDEDTPYSTGNNADGGDFTFTETTNYDGGTFAQTDRYHHIYSLYSANISTDDVIITGIRVTNDEDTYLYGEEGYILEIEDNPFSIGKEQEVATHLGQKIIGMQFRPLNITAQSNPLIEAGDPVYVSHKGNSYQCFITNSTFTIGQSSQLSCDAESYQGRRVQGLSGNTKAIIQARRVAKKEISSYDLEQQRFNNLVFHSFGLYRTNEVLEDGSTVEYAHDKPTLAESMNIWRQSANAFAVSNDGGVNWRGMDADGNILANVLSAVGVNAEWINVLTNFKVGNNFNVDQYGNLMASNANISGTVNATSGTFTGSITSPNATITGGSFNVTSSSPSIIQISDSNYRSSLGGYSLELSSLSSNSSISYSSSGINWYHNNNNTSYIDSLGNAAFAGGVIIDKSLQVYGTKNRVVDTKNYGEVLLNAYETPRPTFADTGHAQLDDAGLCYIDIDLIFLETIDQTHSYRYFLTKYGQGALWIKESNTDYFVVEGTPNLEFDWKIEAVQRDYNTHNLEKFEGVGYGVKEVDYIELTNEYLAEYEKELIA